MSDTFYGQGITVASGFDLGAKTPLDSRLVANTIEERDAHVTNNRAYDGMIVYVVEDKTTYQYLKGEWVIFGAEVIDNLGSTSVIKGLSANQGRVLDEKIADVSEQVDSVNEKLGNIDYNDLQNKPNIPSRTSQLTNDSNYVTKEYVDEKVAEGGSGTGNANIHVGTEPPADTSYMWIDTSAPYGLDVTTYEGRLRLKYIEMLNLVVDKLYSLTSKLNMIETNINKISSENSVKINELKTELASIRSKISSLLSRITSTQAGLAADGNLSELKTTSKALRKEMKTVLYSLADLSYNVMVVLDSDMQIIVPDNPDEPSGGDTDGTPLLTEHGVMLLTEDELPILLDGVVSSDILADAILTELGYVLLTENNKQILKG